MSAFVMRVVYKLAGNVIVPVYAVGDGALENHILQVEKEDGSTSPYQYSSLITRVSARVSSSEKED